MTQHETAASRPARPGTGVTADGRRLAEVVSYALRTGSLDARQAAAWESHAHEWWIPDEEADQDGFEVQQWFERPAPLIVEIGCGVGDTTAALAAARPSYNILGFEVWRPGIAETFRRLEQSGAGNVRMMSVDAAWAIEHLLAPGTVSELWTFFPDPWPKKRHHRRRLVSPRFAAVAASRLTPGGTWRLATDWQPYADQMTAVLSHEALLESVDDGPASRWAERPVTRFERRGIEAGRPIIDLAYRRLPG